MKSYTQNIVWITKDKKGMMSAENSRGRVIAAASNLTVLEGFLDTHYKFNWVGYVGIS